jgi:hypothetical protein
MHRKTMLMSALSAVAFLTVAATSPTKIPGRTAHPSAVEVLRKGTATKLLVATGAPGAIVPKLALMGAESEVYQGKKYTLTTLTITNWAEFSAGLFKSAPELPACGGNRAASRTWLTIHRQDTGAYIYGFCAIASPSDLKEFSYAIPADLLPPTEVFVRLTDRKTNTTFQSNCINAWSGVACGKP